jgi:hypothetical protein
MHRRLLDYNPEAETYESISATGVGRASGQAVFGEADEMELAAGLLGVTNHGELERFLGGVIDQAGRAIGKAVPSSARSALAGILTTAARQALPAVERTFTREPSRADSAAPVASAAARYLGLELEGLSPEDQEFEAAKQFIRFVGDAAKNAAGPASASPQAAAAQAAHRFAPGLRGSLPGAPSPTDEPFAAAQSGRWVRRGSNIIVLSS